MSDLVKVGRLWKKTGKAGTFYSGTIDLEKLQEVATAKGEATPGILLFPVKPKDGETPNPKAPHVEMFISSESTPRQARPAPAAKPAESDFDRF